MFAAIVDDGPCSFLKINMIDESEVYSHTGEGILAATSHWLSCVMGDQKLSYINTNIFIREGRSLSMCEVI